MAQAELAVKEFWTGLYDLRNKTGICNVYAVLQLIVADETGQEGEIFTSMHCGNEMMREPMTAWAFGQEQAKRQEKIAELLRQKSSVKKSINKK